MEVLLVLAIVISVPLFLWFMWAQNNKRKEQARRVAAGAGLNIDIDTKDPPPAPFDLMEKGNRRRVSYHMWPTGSQDSVFNYRYTTGSGDDSRRGGTPAP